LRQAFLAPKESPAGREAVKVLVVDDSEAIRERLVEMVRELPGAEIVGPAEDGEQALELVRKHLPDGIILDIRMPRKNGIEFLREVRAIDRYKPLIVVLTNYPYPHYEKKCLELGASFFLDKSRDFERIPEVLGAGGSSVADVPPVKPEG
jgi:DNA-binding NarL/FixJ family response regulator